MKWETKKLKDICYRITKGTTPTTYGYSFVDSGINYIKAESITEEGRILPNTFAFIDEATNAYLKRSILASNDILISIAGAKLGKCGFLTEQFLPANTNQAVGIVRVNPAFAIPKYVFFNFVNRQTYQLINSLNSQAAQPNFNLGQLGDMEFNYPSLPIQRRIAYILSAYDDLIENNLRRIKLLEEAARCEYKMLMEDSTSEVPLQKMSFPIKRGISPKYVTSDGIVVINQKCIRTLNIDYSQTRLTDKSKRISEERMLKKYDVLINSTGAGTLGRVSINLNTDFETTVDSHVTIVRALNQSMSTYLAMSVLSQQHIISMMGEGSTNQTELSPKRLGQEIRIPVVNNGMIANFHKSVSYKLDLIWNLSKQNTQLRQARDLLLPKLMSGEIDVEEIPATTYIEDTSFAGSIAAEDEVVYQQTNK